MVIYKTTNTINSKFYIGQDSKNNPSYLGSGLYLKRAIEKYGKEHFIKEILQVCDDKDSLNAAEIYWIRELRATEIGYNIVDGGQGGNLGKHSNEKTSKSLKEYFRLHPNCRAGKNNSRYNSTQYKFINYKTGESFNGTKYELAQLIGSLSIHIHAIVNESRRHHKGWILHKNKNIYTQKYFKNLQSMKSKKANSLRTRKDFNKGKHWYYDPITYKSTLTFNKPDGYVKGRKSKKSLTFLADIYRQEINIFDLDDCLVITDGKIKVYDKANDNHIISLSPAEYNEYEVKANHRLDFSEFQDPEILRAGHIIDWVMNILQKTLDKGKAVGILTARNDKELVREFLLENGVDIYPDFIFAVGSEVSKVNIPNRKKKALYKLAKYGFTKFKMFDDNIENLRAIKSISDENPELRIAIRHIKEQWIPKITT